MAIDLSTVTYISSAATTVLSRWRQELAVLRGEVQLTSLPPAVREALAILGWNSRFEANAGSGAVDGPIGPSTLFLANPLHDREKRRVPDVGLRAGRHACAAAFMAARIG